MLSKMGFRQLISAGLGGGSTPTGSFRRGIRLTAGREFLRDPTKRVLAAHEVAAPAAAPDLPHFVDMRQGDKVRRLGRRCLGMGIGEALPRYGSWGGAV